MKLEESKRLNIAEKLIFLAKCAYVLSTVKWETSSTFEPITERGSQSYLESKRYFPYIGRGYVMLTWLENYIKFGSKLGIDLQEEPTLANDPEIAWKILEMGMTDTELGIQDPDFTKYTLEDFFHGETMDFYNARKIINLKDYNTYKPIANDAIKFFNILQQSSEPEAKKAIRSYKLSENFNLSEFACKDDTPVPDDLIPNVEKLVSQLQILREAVNEPISIISGYRTAEHNKKVSGATQSQHLTASAADIMCKNTNPVQLREILTKLIKEGKIQDGGIGSYVTFTHYDIGKPRTW